MVILPQLVLLQRTKNVDTLTGNYVFLLGGYGQSAVPAELDLPVPHRAGVQAVDRVGERRRADRRVLRLFLLLLEILAQEREAAASELRRGKSVERDVPRAGVVREHTDSL